jgi:hypothetical protein
MMTAVESAAGDRRGRAVASAICATHITPPMIAATTYRCSITHVTTAATVTPPTAVTAWFVVARPYANGPMPVTAVSSAVSVSRRGTTPGLLIAVATVAAQTKPPPLQPARLPHTNTAQTPPTRPPAFTPRPRLR